MIEASGDCEQYIPGQLFCLFGKAVKNPFIETVRPQSYGVGGRFFIFFLSAINYNYRLTINPL
jgi:hypothetical protein